MFSCPFFFFNDTPTTEIYTLSYTTLFRSEVLSPSTAQYSPTPKWRYRSSRSEEHTSELQSQSNIVCRLLLEKKNASEVHTLIYHGLTYSTQEPLTMYLAYSA